MKKSVAFFLFMSAALAAGAPTYAAEGGRSALFNFKSGEVAVLDDQVTDLTWKGPDNFQSTELFERDFGFVQELMAGKSVGFDINWTLPRADAKLLLTFIGYPENSAPEILVKENNGGYKAFAAPPANTLAQIAVPLTQLVQGRNLITIGLKKGFIGLQTIELRYEVPLASFSIGGGELTLTNASLAGQALEKGRTLWVSWSLSETVSPETVISWQYKTNKGGYRYIREGSGILVSHPNTNPAETASSGKFRWVVPEDIASLELKVVEGKAAVPVESTWSKLCLSGEQVPADSQALYNALLEIAGTSDCLEAEERLQKRSDFNLHQKGIRSLALLLDFRNISSLDLSANPGISIGSLSALPKLQKLSLADCEFTSVSGIEKLTSLQTLNLSGNRLAKVDELNSLPQLKSLDLNNNELASIDGLLNRPFDKLSFDGNYLCANGRAYGAAWEEFISNGKLRYSCTNGRIDPKEAVCKPGFVASNFRCIKAVSCPSERKAGEVFSNSIPGGKVSYLCDNDRNLIVEETSCDSGYEKQDERCEAKVSCNGLYKADETFTVNIENGKIEYLCEASGSTKVQTVSCDSGFSPNHAGTYVSCGKGVTSFLVTYVPSPKDITIENDGDVHADNLSPEVVSGILPRHFEYLSLNGKVSFNGDVLGVKGRGLGFTAQLSDAIGSVSGPGGMKALGTINLDYLSNSKSGLEPEAKTTIYCTSDSGIILLMEHASRFSPGNSEWSSFAWDIGPNFFSNEELQSKGCKGLWISFSFFGHGQNDEIKLKSMTWGLDAF